MKIGIDKIACYTPGHYLDLKTLASLYQKDPSAYYDVLGQEQMSMPTPDEDAITQGANAAWQILKDEDCSQIKTLYFATESAVDQSKSCGMYLHRLLNLPSNCRVIELKQACYSGTFALRAAINEIEKNSEQKSLVVMSDIARYGLGSPGELTQGAGAVAMLITANPKIAEINPDAGIYAEDAMDFWRPNYRDEAFVDGQYSVRLYLKMMLKAWHDLKAKRSTELASMMSFCFHLPFSTIAEKAFSRLARKEEQVVSDQDMATKVHPGLQYNRLTGNCYTASLYQSFCSLLDNDARDLSGTDVGLFSYGSGSMAEFFTATIQPGYRQHICSDYHKSIYHERKELDYEEYKKFYNFSLPQDGQDFQCPRLSSSRFRLAGIKKHKRLYETQKSAQ